MLKKIVAVGLLVAALGATASTAARAFCPPFCTTGDQMSNIRAGMTKDQVITVLGRPIDLHNPGQLRPSPIAIG